MFDISDSFWVKWNYHYTGPISKPILSSKSLHMNGVLWCQQVRHVAFSFSAFLYVSYLVRNGWTWLQYCCPGRNTPNQANCKMILDLWISLHKYNARKYVRQNLSMSGQYNGVLDFLRLSISSGASYIRMDFVIIRPQQLTSPGLGEKKSG